MSESPDKPQDGNPATQPAASWRRALLQRHPWLPFLLPLVAYMLVGSLEPSRELVDASTPPREEPGGEMIGLAIPYSYYPLVYCVRIALTFAAVLFVWPAYRAFPFRVSPLAVVVGAVGVVVWVGLCAVGFEQNVLVPVLKPLKLHKFIDAGTRSAFNPLEQFDDAPVWAWSFLAVRFFGLAAVVPLIEEFFLRGFVMRFVMDRDWWKIPIGQVTPTAVVLATLIPMAMHPAELLAAAVWFSMITWLLVRTRNIWDCIVAHAVTNLLLGIYVVAWDQWQFM